LLPYSRVLKSFTDWLLSCSGLFSEVDWLVHGKAVVCVALAYGYLAFV